MIVYQKVNMSVVYEVYQFQTLYLLFRDGLLIGRVPCLEFAQARINGLIR